MQWGIYFLTDAGNNAIRELNAEGDVSTLAGGNLGTADGIATSANFNNPEGKVIDPQGNLYVVDNGSSLIRKVTSSRQVFTIAGTGSTGFNNGIGTQVDYTFAVAELRTELTRLLILNELWDKRGGLLQVTDAKENTIELRALVSAQNSSEVFDLRCYIRENLLKYITEIRLPHCRKRVIKGQKV